MGTRKHQGSEHTNAAESFEFERIKLLFEYTKFHIGLYSSVAAAFLALTEYLDLKNSGPHLGLILISIVLLILAGFFGGVIASSISIIKEEDIPLFFTMEIGPYDWKWFNTTTWIRWEHNFFWAGVLLGAGTFCLFLWTR